MYTPETSPLGKSCSYQMHYDPTLLFAIARQPKRADIGITNRLPFFGVDIWNAYELSWLNLRGKPQVAIASFSIPADSSHMIESKSFKLYLNSLNQVPFTNVSSLISTLRQDISTVINAPVIIHLFPSDTFSTLAHIICREPEGFLLDQLDVAVSTYHPKPTLLQVNPDATVVEETFLSHLLKSNCPVTGQPDWATIQIHYIGTPIRQDGLLQYLISFREHSEFHEQCIERIFMDILQQCTPQKLSVYARYTRRGGLDINPWRSNFSSALPSNHRHARQ